MDDKERKFRIQSRRFPAVPLACGCLIYPPYLQAVFVNATRRFLRINMRCHYYPDPHLRMLPMSTILQLRDLGVTCCPSNRTTWNNRSSASQRQSDPSHLPSRSQTFLRRSIPSRSRRFFVPRSPGTPKLSSAALSTFAICADCRTTPSTIPFSSLSQHFLSKHCRSK